MRYDISDSDPRLLVRVASRREEVGDLLLYLINLKNAVATTKAVRTIELLLLQVLAEIPGCEAV
jgi:hypothetical protein